MVDVVELELVKKEFEKMYPNQVIYDGVVDIDKFSAAKHKILWILKEPNDRNKSSWSLLEFMKDRDSLTQGYSKWRRTYKMIIKSTYAILHDSKSHETVPPEYDIADILGQIAFINISKVGGTSKSYYRKIAEYYQKNKPLLMRQIAAIQPSIIINCSHMPVGNDLGAASWQQIGRFSTAKLGNDRIINAYHPASITCGHNEYLDTIIKCVNS